MLKVGIIIALIFCIFTENLILFDIGIENNAYLSSEQNANGHELPIDN